MVGGHKSPPVWGFLNVGDSFFVGFERKPKGHHLPEKGFSILKSLYVHPRVPKAQIRILQVPDILPSRHPPEERGGPKSPPTWALARDGHDFDVGPEPN